MTLRADKATPLPFPVVPLENGRSEGISSVSFIQAKAVLSRHHHAQAMFSTSSFSVNVTGLKLELPFSFSKL